MHYMTFVVHNHVGVLFWFLLAANCSFPLAQSPLHGFPFCRSCTNSIQQAPACRAAECFPFRKEPINLSNPSTQIPKFSLGVRPFSGHSPKTIRVSQDAVRVAELRPEVWQSIWVWRPSCLPHFLGLTRPGCQGWGSRGI